MPVLLAGRVLQGAGAALVSAAALALVLELHPEGPGRNRALGIWGGLGASGAAVGLVLGGLLTDLAGWPLVFAVNLLPGAAAVLLAGRVLPDGRPPIPPRGVPPAARPTGAQPVGQRCADPPGGPAVNQRPARLDVPGALTATLGVGTLVLAVTGTRPVPVTAALLAAAAALLVGFVLVERRAPDPLVPLRLLTRGPLPASAVALGCLLAVIGSQGFFLVLHLQRGLGLDPTTTGLTIAPSAVLAFLASTGGARLVGRLPPRVLVVGGLVLVAVAQLLLAGLPDDLLPGLLLFGFGLGAAFLGATVLGTSGLAGADQGVASGLLNTAQQVGLAVGVAALVGVAGPGGYGTGLRLGALVAVVGIAVMVFSRRSADAGRVSSDATPEENPRCTRTTTTPDHRPPPGC
jgi:predicted MFS family arabinose efflux permease